MATSKRITEEERSELIERMRRDFDAIQCARPPWVIKNLVVGVHQTVEQQWAQCVLEMQNADRNIRRAMLRLQKIDQEIEACSDPIDADLKRIDREELESALLGASREFDSLYEVYQGFGRSYTREELDAAQPELYRRKLAEQAFDDMRSRQLGISPGNLLGMRHVGIEPTQVTQLADRNQPDVLRIAGVQQRFLEGGKARVLIVVPTEHAPRKDELLPVLRGLILPGEIETKTHVIYGMPIADAANEAAMMALQEGATHVLFIEDDTFAPSDAISRLLRRGVDVVAGWYPKRQHGPLTGTPIIVRDNLRQTLDVPDGSMQECYTVPMGCTLIRTSVFQNMPFPFFVTTPQLTQDSYFSQQAREAGIKLWCDTSILCKHVDRKTKEVFEWPTVNQ